MILSWFELCRYKRAVSEFDATSRVLSATLTVVMLVADRSWAGVPRRTTSDLSVLSWRPFCRNQRWPAAELWASLLMASVALVLSMLTRSCVISELVMTRRTTPSARQQLTCRQNSREQHSHMIKDMPFVPASRPTFNMDCNEHIASYCHLLTHRPSTNRLWKLLDLCLQLQNE